MSDPTFGRAVSIHFLMLDLACWHGPVLPGRRGDRWVELPHEGKIKRMIQARAALSHKTGEDFGFSLSAWRNFLLARIEEGVDDFGYGHPYARNRVDKAVLSCVESPDRAALEREATEVFDSLGSSDDSPAI